MGLQRTVFAFHPTAAIKGVDDQGIPPFMKKDSAVNSRMIMEPDLNYILLLDKLDILPL